MISGDHPVQFLITLDNDDDVANSESSRNYLEGFANLVYKYGPHKTKIDAINADMEDQDFDILVVVSDDMLPVVKGFDNIIVRDMLQYFPKLDGALHYNDDGHCGEKIISLTVMGKKLYDRFGYIYNPAYTSFYCDTEFTDEVRRMKKVVYFPETIIHHTWHGGPRSDDARYRRNSKMGRGDRNVYEQRKQLNFPRVGASSL